MKYLYGLLTLLFCASVFAQVPGGGGVPNVPVSPGGPNLGTYYFTLPSPSGAVDDSAAINAVLAQARTAAQASILNQVVITCPTQGAYAVGGFSARAGGPINMTGFTKSNVTWNCPAVFYGELSQGPIETFSLTAGSGGTNGTYNGVSLTGGSGTGATANITVAGNVVTSVVMVTPGINFIQGDTVSASSSDIGNTTGFSITLTGVGPVIDALGSIGIDWQVLNIIGDCTHKAGIGIQWGRVNTTSLDNGGSGMNWGTISVTGCFTRAAALNFSGENNTSPTWTQWKNGDTGNGNGIIFDGYNHFNVTSSFVTNSAPVDAAQSFEKNMFLNMSSQSGGSGSPVWIGGLRDSEIDGGDWIVNSATSCLTLYNEAQAFNSGLLQNFQINQFHCEGASGTDAVLISGNVAAPQLIGLTLRAGIISNSNSIFRLDASSSVTSASCQGCNISIAGVNTSVANTLKMFNEPQSWTAFSGSAYTITPGVWNEPNGWSGSITLGNNTWNYPDRPGPLDFLASSSGAWSSARRLGRSYTGPIVNIKNTTSSATADIYADQSSGIPLSAVAGLLVTGAAGNFITQYDQSGSATGNLTQATTASQPTDTIQLSTLGNRNVAQYGDGGAIAMPSASTLSGLFTAGGFVSHVVNQSGTPAAADRVWQKTNAIFQYLTGGSAALSFLQSTGGSWTTQAALANGGHVLDIQYNAASIANVPTIGFDGAAQSLTVGSTQPSSIGADSGTVIVGNSTTTAGTRGFPGSIAEIIMWKTIPAANVLDAIRRNQAGFYGLTTVQ